QNARLRLHVRRQLLDLLTQPDSQLHGFVIAIERLRRAKADEAIAGHERLVGRGPANRLAPEAMMIGVAGAVAIAPGAIDADEEDPAETVIVPHHQGEFLLAF